MKTIQMTLDEDLLSAVDKAVKTLKTTRSAFTRQALCEALSQLKNTRLEQRHKRGYERHPASQKEFSVWEDEQVWGE
jgi:metal-responsive CopG/Arc/MetJ family transcriptional regulator